MSDSAYPNGFSVEAEVEIDGVSWRAEILLDKLFSEQMPVGSTPHTVDLYPINIWRDGQPVPEPYEHVEGTRCAGMWNLMLNQMLEWSSPPDLPREVQEKLSGALRSAMEVRPGIAIVCALGPRGEFGLRGGMPWPRIPGDLPRFRTLTVNRPVIMGRATWESLPRRPLPERMNIVLTSQSAFVVASEVSTSDHCIARDMREALAVACLRSTSPSVIGGARPIREALRSAMTIHLTRVHAPLGGEGFEHDVAIPELLELVNDATRGFRPIHIERGALADFFTYRWFNLPSVPTER
jgi:dihydrofolate reductase